MLVIIFNWIYILISIFCLGFAFNVFCDKFLHYRIKSMGSILISGLVLATVYAQLFSLFYRVNIEATIILILICVTVLIVFRKQIVSLLKTACKEGSLFCKIAIPILFLAWCYFTSRGYSVPDMDLYHGQSIRWIEEYGIVKGLGNLHFRFAYNSSIFAVSALYSMKFLLGQSLHAVNGLIAFIMSIEVLNLRKCFSRRKMLFSDYARVGLFYYLSIVWEQIIAPSSDYAVMFILFYIVIRWLTVLEREEEKNIIAPYALLCVLGVYALTLKLTAGLILILLIKPAYNLLKEKRWKEIGIYLLMGLMVAVPWMSRTVIISGWLLYPFPALDLFDFEWKMRDLNLINSDASLIKSWAKGTVDIGENLPLKVWYPHWFRTQLFTTEKLLILGDLLSLLLVIIYSVIAFIRKKKDAFNEILVLVTVSCCYLFWQFSAPMMRYGYAYVLLLVTLAMGYLIRNMKLAPVVYIVLLIAGIYKLYIGVDYIARSYLVDAYVWQADYGTYEVASYDVDGVTIYYSPTAYLTGYDPFPSVSQIVPDLELLGDNIKDGFRRSID